jgi:uncharacterized metal-binding protein
MAGTLLLAGGAWLVATQQVPSTVLLGLGAGILITPDLDVDGRTHEEARIRRLSRSLGMLWQVLWYPYALAMPHRSPLSHAPLVGTAGRIGYLATVAALGSALVATDLMAWRGIQWPWWEWMLKAAAWPGLPLVFVGWAAQDGLHWLMDMLFKNGRR